MSTDQKSEQELKDQEGLDPTASTPAGPGNLEEDVMKELNEEFENLTSEDEMSFNNDFDEEDDLFDDF